MNARVAKLEGEEAKRIREIYKKKIGFVMNFFFIFERLRWEEIGFFSITLDSFVTAQVQQDWSIPEP